MIQGSEFQSKPLSFKQKIVSFDTEKHTYLIQTTFRTMTYPLKVMICLFVRLLTNL